MTRSIGPEDIVVTKWGARFRGRRFPCAIGKGGITDAKREGDGATPRGIHALPQVWARPDRAQVHGAHQITPRDLWCDAPKHALYNSAVKSPFSESHEKLRRADRLYDLFVVTDWNWPEATAHKGSAIFIHRWRKPRHPTEGCVAFRADHLAWIVARLTPRSRLVIR
ncbi:L,D-transpeptidase family protein [Celeribacter sp.]|uniref:L,D-transpeptidase family protein n=1 Tax=Celeribacter sp. TaxID=1890673 RepID=UPI003A9210DB